MMKNKAIFLLLIIFLFNLSACKESDNSKIIEKNHEKTNIVLLHGWGTMADDDITMREIYQDFEQKNPDINLTIVSMPSFESLEVKAQNMLAVGKTPNIIYTGVSGSNTLYNFMVGKNSAVDLMPYIQEDPEFMKSISPYIIKRWQTKDGKLYTVTDMINTKGYWYNKKIFRNAKIDELPKTWGEFYQISQKINTWSNQNKWNTVVMDFDSQKSAVLIQAMLPDKLLLQDKYPLVKQDQSFYQSLVLMKKIITDNNITSINEIYKNSLLSFNVGHSAIYIGEVWEAKKFSKNLEIGFALFPHETGHPAGQLSTCSGYIISNWGDKAEQEASVRFVKYMLSKPVQEIIMKKTGRIPSNPEVHLEEIKAKMPIIYDSYMKIISSDIIKETPENSWNYYIYRNYTNNIVDYINNKIDENELIHFMSEE